MCCVCVCVRGGNNGGGSGSGVCVSVFVRVCLCVAHFTVASTLPSALAHVPKEPHSPRPSSLRQRLVRMFKDTPTTHTHTTHTRAHTHTCTHAHSHTHAHTHAHTHTYTRCVHTSARRECKEGPSNDQCLSISAQRAAAPLPPQLAQIAMPSNEMVSDQRLQT
jgi:hypothetical protein